MHGVDRRASRADSIPMRAVSHRGIYPLLRSSPVGFCTRFAFDQLKNPQRIASPERDSQKSRSLAAYASLCHSPPHTVCLSVPFTKL